MFVSSGDDQIIVVREDRPEGNCHITFATHLFSLEVLNSHSRGIILLSNRDSNVLHDFWGKAVVFLDNISLNNGPFDCSRKASGW